MSTTTARQSNFDESLEDWSTPSTRIAVPSGTGVDTSKSAPMASAWQVPDFRYQGQAHVEMSRQAGRLNAASISDEEHDQLLQERQDLLDKLFVGTISRKETLRLEYVRWSLDRIEDARFGRVLDVIESNVELYERFSFDLSRLQEDLMRHAGAQRRGRKK